MKQTRTDRLLLVMTALFVGGLAVVAGAVSFAHMRELATHHDQLGWESSAFPVSVDGLEIVASLYLVAQRRAGRAAGWTPWVALIVGTLASLAANVAAGGADPIGRALAGWPAVSLLVSVKLLFSMIDHTKDDQQPSPAVPDGPGTVQHAGQDGRSSSGTSPAHRTYDRDPSAAVPAGQPTGAQGHPATAGRAAADRTTDPGDRAAPLDLRTVAHLIPAARVARTALASKGQSLSRDALAAAMREGGHGVSNARASLLLTILKAEQNVTPFMPTGATTGGLAEREPVTGSVSPRRFQQPA